MTIGPREIYELSKSGRTDIINQHIDQGLDINITDEHGNTALHIAVIERSFASIIFLMRNYALNINALNGDGLTPLNLAIQNGHEGSVVHLIKFGASLSITSAQGNSPLHLAFIYGNVHLIGILCKQPGLNLFQLSHEGLTAFHYALKLKNKDIYESLVHAAGSNIPIALISELLTIANENSDETFAPIICNQENINRQDEIGRTILHHIAETNRYGHITQTLINLGANPNIPDDMGDTPLCYAIRSENIKAVKILLEVSTIEDINRPLNIAITTGNIEIMNLFLEHQASNGNLESVILLIQNNANINYTNRDGYSPLHLAIRNGHNGVVNFLINSGADLSNFSTHKFTALHIAAIYRNHDAIYMLLERLGDDVYQTSSRGYTAFHYAVMTGDINNIRPFINNNIRINHLTEDNDSALHLAILSKLSNEVLEYLIANGADTNLISGSMNLTPLQLAIGIPNNQAVELLLRRGANVNGMNLNNETPLHTATRVGNTEAITTLLQLGADVLHRNGNGYNVFHFAAMYGSIEIFQLLLQSLNQINASTAEDIRDLRIHSIHARSNQGITPLHLAVEGRHLELVRWLVDNGASYSKEIKMDVMPYIMQQMMKKP